MHRAIVLISILLLSGCAAPAAEDRAQCAEADRSPACDVDDPPEETERGMTPGPDDGSGRPPSSDSASCSRQACIRVTSMHASRCANVDCTLLTIHIRNPESTGDDYHLGESYSPSCGDVSDISIVTRAGTRLESRVLEGWEDTLPGFDRNAIVSFMSPPQEVLRAEWHGERLVLPEPSAERMDVIAGCRTPTVTDAQETVWLWVQHVAQGMLTSDLAVEVNGTRIPYDTTMADPSGGITLSAAQATGFCIAVDTDPGSYGWDLRCLAPEEPVPSITPDAAAFVVRRLGEAATAGTSVEVLGSGNEVLVSWTRPRG